MADEPGERHVRIYVAVLAVGAVAAAVPAGLAVAALTPAPALVAGAAIVFAAMILLQWRGVSFYWRGHRLSTQLDEIAVFTGLVVLPAATLVFLIPAAAILTHVAKRRKSWIKGAFNLTAYTVAAAGGVATHVALTTQVGLPLLVSAAVATAVYAFAANALLAVVFALLGSANPLAVFVERLAGPTLASAIVGVAGGVTVHALLAVHPLALLALAPFAYLLWRFGILSARADRELSVHRDLGAVTHDLVGSTNLDMAADRVLDACGRLLECGRVTLVLKDGRSWTRDFDGPADYYVGQALPGRAGEDLGEIRVHPRRGNPSFGELERELLRLIGGQVASAVENTRTLAALESARAKLERFLSTAQDTVLLVGPDGRVDYVNAAGQRLLGLDGPGAHASDFFAHPVLTRRVRPDGPVLVETEARERSGGRRFVVEANVSPLGDDGDSLLAVVRDVTERKRLEEETVRQRELLIRQEKLSTLGTLVAGVAHEVNNPLTYMKASLQLAAEDARGVIGDESASPQARRLAKSTLESCEATLKGVARIETITSSLKGVARQGSRQASEDLNAVVREVLAVLKAGKPRNVALEAALTEEPARVFGNQGQLHQVVLNLVKNGIEAVAGRDGSVCVTTRRVHDQIVLEVVDDGGGIPPATLDRLFAPFQTTKENGTGLGLSISREIVVAHGGELSARNGAHGGAIFTVRLPAAQDANPAPERPRAA